MKKRKLKFKHLAVLSTVAASMSFVSCTNIVSYNWEKTDEYGIPIPKHANDLHLYLSFLPNLEAISSTSAIIAANAINQADLNEKINALLSFVKPKGDFIPDNFSYEIKAKVDDFNKNSINLVLTATEKKSGDKADINFALSGFKEHVSLTDEQREIINNNILEVNGLRYLVDGFDISKLNEVENKNRMNAFRWSKSILSKYEEMLFPKNPLANFFYASTFDNGIKRVNFVNDFKRNSIITINTLTDKYVEQRILEIKQNQSKLDQLDPDEKAKFNNLTIKIRELENLKKEVNKKFLKVNNGTTQEKITELFNSITQSLNLQQEIDLLNLSKEFVQKMQESVDKVSDFIEKNINNKDKKVELEDLVKNINSSVLQVNSVISRVNSHHFLSEYYNQASNLYLQIFLARNFENVLSVKNAEFNALTGANELIYKKELQVIKNNETNVIEDEGYSDAPRVRTVIQKLVFLAQAYLINDKNNTLYKNKRLKEVITIIMDDFSKNYYFKGQQQFVNWWFYEIGIPRDLTRLLGVLTKVYNDELSSEDKRLEYEQKFKNWSAGINYFLPNARYGGAAKTAILNFVPVSSKRSQTGANVVDTAKPIIVAGILTKNIEQVQDSLLAMYDNLFRDYVKQKDGFYRDGSFIQHGNISYVGSYGEVLYTGIADIFKYFENSVFDLSKDLRFEKIYQFTELSVMPFMFKMSISDGLSGRSIVRANHSDKQKGMNILGALTIIIKGAPEKYKARLNNFILDQISTFTAKEIQDFGSKYKVRDLYVQNLIEFLNKPRLDELPRTFEDWKFYETNYFNKKYEPSTISISSKDKINEEVGVDLLKRNNGLWFTKNQDRYVWQQDDFMFNINLRGRVVGFPEATLGENLESYYYADGSTLLHTSNQNEPYANDYWSTINAELIPGTTSIHTSQFNRIYNYNYPDFLGPDVTNWTDKKAKKNYDEFSKLLQDKRKRIEDISLSVNKSFNNGIIFNNMGYVKAMVQNWNSTLITRKAYFMIDNQIIVVGNAYNGNSTSETVTTIENKMLKNPSDADFSESLVKVNNKEVQKFIYRDTSSKETNGYFVLDNKGIIQERQEQKYAIISNATRDLTKEKDRLKRTFKTLTIDHKNSENFVYSIVPNYSEKDEAKYLNVLNNFKILVNNHDYIVASYTKEIDNKKVTTYFISSFFEPDESKKAKDLYGQTIGEDREYLSKFEKGVYVPGLDVTINIKLPTTLIIQKEDNSKLWKVISSSDTNERNYEIYFNKPFINFNSKVILNGKIDYASKTNNESRIFRRNSKKVGIIFFNNLGIENNIKHNNWFTMEEK